MIGFEFSPPGRVIGNGMIASEVVRSWSPSSDFVIFASGVSDSSCTKVEEFQREASLLLQVISEMSESQTLVYFSTCSIFDPSLVGKSAYVRHKREMEAIVCRCGSFQIFRLPQVVGYNKGRKTLVNYFYDNLVSGRELVVQRDAERNLIDVSDAIAIASVVAIGREFPNSSINIANTRYHAVSRILQLLCDATGMQPRVRYVDGGSAYRIDTGVVEQISGACGVVFDEAYLPRVINRYYKEGGI